MRTNKSRVQGRRAYCARYTPLAAAYGKGGQAEEGLLVLAGALATVNKTGECVWEAGLYRLKGELLLAQAGKSQND